MVFGKRGKSSFGSSASGSRAGGRSDSCFYAFLFFLVCVVTAFYFFNIVYQMSDNNSNNKDQRSFPPDRGSSHLAISREGPLCRDPAHASLPRAGADKRTPERRYEDDDEDQAIFNQLDEDRLEEESKKYSDDVTFLFAVINMNRTAHLGIENYTFEKDYLKQIERLLKIFKNHKVQIIIQKQYYPNLESHLDDNVNVRFVEVEDLRQKFPHYKDIERIRKTDWWHQSTGWLKDVPQGYSDLYNPIVMQKIIWLRDLAVLNPFNTKYFVWLDSGGICTPRINPDYGMPVPEFKEKAIYYMQKGFLVTALPYAQSHEMHGCHRSTMYQLTHGHAPAFVLKGWLMGGERRNLIKVTSVYEDLLARSLQLGCLGTEETILTLAWYRQPKLFNVHYNSNKDYPFEGGGVDCCNFIWTGQDYKDKPYTYMQKWVEEQKEKEAAAL